MTTPPPPPSTPGPSWPASGGAASFGAGGSGGGAPASWWSTGRVIAAIVLVLALMAGSAGAGFVVGLGAGGFLGVGGVTTHTEEPGGTSFGDMTEEFSDDVPGAFGADSPATSEGPPLSVGSRAVGTVNDGPTEHLLTVGGGMVAIEVVEADFDSVLVLLDQDGTLIATDDDGGVDNLSRIEIDLDEGTYLLRVQPWFSGSGGYTVSVV